ncbi:MAG: glutamine-hydrolyzing GMP synthase [Bacteroidales bacterium]|nr:glutamine-hydrolyzing GMP synthase [Bacteroidales bacterium]
MQIKTQEMKENFIENAIKEIKETVGNKSVLLALSGGVDSAVCAALLHKAIGHQLTCVYVNHGLMRKNESEQIMSVFKDGMGLNLIKIDASEMFLEKLKGIIDPETKRKIIGETFIKVFEKYGEEHGAVDFLAQGTIYPDIVESGKNKDDVIKSHHNVGGLPSVIKFAGIIEPLKDLYKDEVREVGLTLGLPPKIVMRQPFPGPGLGVRVIGEITKEKLDILREADHIFCTEIENANLDIWQYSAILTNLKTVGIRDGKRSYEYVLALRAVLSKDAMTAKIAHIPYDVLERAVEKITQNVVGINRVVYDITSKPPATIEWE